MGTTPGWLEQGRDAHAGRAWARAFVALERADADAPLGADDLELLATSAYMLGRVDDFLAILERAYEAHVEGGRPLRASRCAFFLGVNLILRGEPGRASGWFGRAHRLVEREGGDSAEQGYLRLPVSIQSELAGDYEAAYSAATEAAEAGERFRDMDLFSLATHQQGLVRIKQGRVGEGLALLDEAMLSAIDGALSPIVTGVVYCGVIAGCEEAFELGRAREWTGALSTWCEQQPEMVAFNGRCLAHRAELLQLDGDWKEALEVARRARERCEQAMNLAAAGQALYQQAEILRRRGEFAEAEDAYREANRYGREPQPGLALLRLAQGKVDRATAAIGRSLAEAVGAPSRARLLPAYVEIMLAAGDAPAARDAAGELREIAEGFESSLLSAIAEQATGAVELAEGDARSALGSLRRSAQAWQELEAPYEAARTRVLIGLACRALGDDETARLELDAAHALFGELGAGRDVARVRSLLRPGPERDAHGLTARELEVLRLVAAGKSNREIAAELVVSEHTVARHVQNIFRKLRVTSRTAATAYAFENRLL
jgi:DNA-binding CsgD family transcriptional regulator